MQPARRNAPAATFLLCFFLAAQSAAAEWSRLESPNFLMYTNAGEKEARLLFEELEGFRALLLQFIRLEIPPDAEKVKVILFRTQAEFKDYTWARDIAGFVTGTRTSAIIAQPARVAYADATYVIYHEYVHVLLRQYPGRLPQWYNEGLAEVFATTRYANGKFDVGIAPEERLRYFSRGGRMASFNDIVSDKFALHTPSPLYDPYVQYWMLAHYLEFGNKDRKQDLGEYLLLYKDGMESLEAFELAFGMTPEQFWDRELESYFTRRKIPGLRVSIALEQMPITYGQADMKAVNADLFRLRAVSVGNAFRVKDYRRGRKLAEDLIEQMDPASEEFLGMINQYVWFLATSPDDRARDGKKALRLGELYMKGKTDDLAYLDTLAAAYAEGGRFEEAASLQAELVSRIDQADEQYAEFAERLEKYRNRQPWREPAE